MTPRQACAIDEADFHSSFTREEYHAVVRKAQEYVRAGDIFQVVPSQRLRVPLMVDSGVGDNWDQAH